MVSMMDRMALRVDRILQMAIAGHEGEELWVAGVSGGIDSMVLLHVVSQTLGKKVVVSHVNYHLRGADSLADQEMVERFCSERNIELRVVDARIWAQEHQIIPGNFQDFARKVRRSHFLSLLEEFHASGILQGHHREDQLETIFQKLLRGSAPENWQGMTEIRAPWIRPLLHFKREEIQEYARRANVPWRTDQSNLGRKYARNRLRNQIFPQLDEPFPGWETNVLNIGEHGRLHKDLLDYVTSRVIVSISAGPISHPEKISGPLDRDKWLTLPESLKIPIARNWISLSLTGLMWSRGMAERLSGLGVLQTGSQLELQPGCSIMRDRNVFVVKGQADAVSGFPCRIYLRDLPGKPGHIVSPVCLYLASYEPGISRGTLQLSLSSLESTIEIRKWQSGDRFRPLGMDADQKVSDHLTNRKVSSARKKESLVITSSGGKIYAVLFPHALRNGEIGSIAEEVRCRQPKESVVCIQLEATSC